MDYNLLDALELLEREKGVPADTILDALANAKGKFKVIASGTMWSDDADKGGKDSQQYIQREGGWKRDTFRVHSGHCFGCHFREDQDHHGQDQRSDPDAAGAEQANADHGSDSCRHDIDQVVTQQDQSD